MNKRRMKVTPVLALLVGGCSHFHTTTQIQEAQMDDTRWAPRSHWRNMADNALLSERSVSDIHFVPETSEISGTGATRLERLAKLLDAYGGTLHYDTVLTDEALIQQRLVHVREYLALAGCNMDRVKVERGLSGGDTIPGDRAIKNYERGTTPPTSQGGGTQGSGAATGLTGTGSMTGQGGSR
ncbi:MAG: hypothetical protein AABZ47_16790 [Planctomycetota bacterium]